MSVIEHKDVWDALLSIQSGVSGIAKDEYSDFGKYSYRTTDAILQPYRPICAEHGCVLHATQLQPFESSGWHYVCVVVTLHHVSSGTEVDSTEYAREEESRPKMQASQCTGTASTFATKYALQHLFMISDPADEPEAQITQADSVASQANTANQDVLQVWSKDAARTEFESRVRAMCDKLGKDYARMVAGIKHKYDFEDTAEWYLSVMAKVDDVA